VSFTPDVTSTFPEQIEYKFFYSETSVRVITKGYLFLPTGLYSWHNSVDVRDILLYGNGHLRKQILYSLHTYWLSLLCMLQIAVSTN
jgi:hypothetical protein